MEALESIYYAYIIYYKVILSFHKRIKFATKLHQCSPFLCPAAPHKSPSPELPSCI